MTKNYDSFNLHIMRKETSYECKVFTNAKIERTQKQTDGGTKNIRQIGVIEIDRDEVEVMGVFGGCGKS